MYDVELVAEADETLFKNILRITQHVLHQLFSLKLHLTTSELWFGQEQEGILLSSSGIV